VSRKTTYADAIADGYGAIEELASEVREAYDNMTGAGMSDSHPKVELCSNSADELEGIQQPDIPSELEELLSREVEVSELVNRDKRRGAARHVRLSNACSLIEVAKSYLEDTPEGTSDEVREAAEQLASELDDAVALDGSVEFPGMFG
jgi:hypothetical protein